MASSRTLNYQGVADPATGAVRASAELDVVDGVHREPRADFGGHPSDANGQGPGDSVLSAWPLQSSADAALALRWCFASVSVDRSPRVLPTLDRDVDGCGTRLRWVAVRNAVPRPGALPAWTVLTGAPALAAARARHAFELIEDEL
ncbi:hypothetical protein HEK616_00830 [Streptomyces nigrescens]|uniref:Uncharacterized protein n=1 Tax=Streptomyces nigrescens TaxID=1920 RepID=A0ABM7ZL89_STRNI|nr:hypothetical protein HEK616_00830 [Streptomyces nigrescens]